MMKILTILNVIALLATLAVNGLANTLPLNGKNTGAISDGIPSLFTPAGYVFAIWGLIYLGLAAYAVYQVLPVKRDKSFVARIGYWFIISSIFNIVWLFLWHYEQFFLSLLAMVGLLGSLLILYVRLGIGRGASSIGDRLLVHLPFSIYLGWISVATIANVSTVLVVLGWNGFGLSPALWTAIMVVIAAVLGIVMSWQRKEIAYPLVIVWALIGIANKQAGVATITIPVWISVGALLAGMVATRLRTGKA
ncbi:MAG: tryptophan-rich sensory protein [Anaerolineae bacterium]|nr:tryptophan-rich sensory protein [Anaerolineae bacterium]